MRPLYARIMGARFDALPQAVRAMHGGPGEARGEAEVTGAAGPMAAMIARAFRFPPAGHHGLHMHFRADGGGETWTRDFGGWRFSSDLAQRGRHLVERLGPFRFAFDLPCDADGLEMLLRRWWLGPLPLPLMLAPRTAAREWAQDGRFHFDVSVALPLFGRLVRYRGWLERV